MTTVEPPICIFKNNDFQNAQNHFLKTENWPTNLRDHISNIKKWKYDLNNQGFVEENSGSTLLCKTFKAPAPEKTYTGFQEGVSWTTMTTAENHAKYVALQKEKEQNLFPCVEFEYSLNGSSTKKSIYWKVAKESYSNYAYINKEKFVMYSFPILDKITDSKLHKATLKFSQIPILTFEIRKKYLESLFENKSTVEGGKKNASIKPTGKYVNLPGFKHVLLYKKNTSTKNVTKGQSIKNQSKQTQYYVKKDGKFVLVKRKSSQ